MHANLLVPIIIDIEPAALTQIESWLLQRGFPITQRSVLHKLNQCYLSTTTGLAIIEELQDFAAVKYIAYDRLVKQILLDTARDILLGSGVARRRAALRERVEGVLEKVHATLPVEFAYRDGWIGTKTIWKALGGELAEKDGITGKGVKVVVIDTGYMRTRQTYRIAVDARSVKATGAGDVDSSGHGTWCISAIRGDEIELAEGVVIRGLSQCDIGSVRALFTPLGAGRTSDIIEAIRMAFEDMGADSVSCSLGAEDYVYDLNEPIAKTIIGYTRIGKLITVAAGNSGLKGEGTINNPGCYSLDVGGCICVGA